MLIQLSMIVSLLLWSPSLRWIGPHHWKGLGLWEAKLLIGIKHRGWKHYPTLLHHTTLPHHPTTPHHPHHPTTPPHPLLHYPTTPLLLYPTTILPLLPYYILFGYYRYAHHHIEYTQVIWRTPIPECHWSWLSKTTFQFKYSEVIQWDKIAKGCPSRFWEIAVNNSIIHYTQGIMRGFQEISRYSEAVYFHSGEIQISVRFQDLLSHLQKMLF